jgi:large subunit ribosomal protein L1
MKKNIKTQDGNLKGGKRIRALRSTLDIEKKYLLDEAVTVIKKNANAKFDETVELVLQLGVDPKHSDQMVRGMVSMPNGTGKTVTVAVFAKDAKADEARAAGADIVGADDLVDDIKDGKVEFDVCIATPDMMGIVGKVAKILGPKGKMPNPKLGTVSTDVKKAVENAKNGQVEFRVEKAGIVHAGVGKVSFDDKKIVENLQALIDAVRKAKPSASKGVYMKSAHLTSTMGPSVEVDLSEIKN